MNKLITLYLAILLFPALQLFGSYIKSIPADAKDKHEALKNNILKRYPLEQELDKKKALAALRFEDGPVIMSFYLFKEGIIAELSKLTRIYEKNKRHNGHREQIWYPYYDYILEKDEDYFIEPESISQETRLYIKDTGLLVALNSLISNIESFRYFGNGAYDGQNLKVQWISKDKIMNSYIVWKTNDDRYKHSWLLDDIKREWTHYFHNLDHIQGVQGAYSPFNIDDVPARYRKLVEKEFKITKFVEKLELSVISRDAIISRYEDEDEDKGQGSFLSAYRSVIAEDILSKIKTAQQDADTNGL